MNQVLFEAFRELAGPAARLVVIPTASQNAVPEQHIKRWQARGFEDVTILDAPNRGVALFERTSDSLKTATAVWISGGYQQRLAEIYVGTPVEEELYALLKRGGVIGGSSAGAAIQTKVMIAGGYPTPQIMPGLDLLKRSIVDQHFLKRDRIARLVEAVEKHPELTGYGIDEGTALVVSGNQAKVVGESYVLRVKSVDGDIVINSFKSGDKIPN
jgi:cyanophycinase